MQTGNWEVWLQFFLTDLADQKAILGYLWFAANQPKSIGHKDGSIALNYHLYYAPGKPLSHALDNA